MKRAQFILKVLSAAWLIALAILGAIALDSSTWVHTQVPFMAVPAFSRDTISVAPYTYGNVPPISLGEISPADNAYVHLKLRFRVDSVAGYPNVFQTAPVNSGIRMEISGTTAAIVVPDKSVLGELKGLTLSTTVKTGQWYQLEVEALNGAFVHAKLEGQNVANYVSEGISMETSQLLVGGGFDVSRAFRGQIDNISVTKGNLPSRAFQRVFYQVLLLGLLTLMIKLLLLLKAKAKVIREYLKNFDWAKYLAIALIAVFGFTLLTAYYFPIYSDEIQVRYWLSRLPYDFPEKISGAPRCLSSFFQPIPSTMYIPGLINWAVHGTLESPTSLRPVGLIVALLWSAGLAFYLYTKAKSDLVQGVKQLSNGMLGLNVTGFIIALFAIGVFPIFLVTNRNEQLILPAVVLLITVFLVSDHLGAKGSLWQRIGLIILYFTAVSLALYGHAKGIFLTPVFVIIGWSVCRHFKSRLSFALVMALLAMHIAQAYLTWKYAFQCSEMPRFESWTKSYSFDPLSLFYDPLYFFDQAYHSVIRFTLYVQQLGFQEWTDVNYLPSLPLDTPAELANILIKLNFTITFFALMFFLPYQYYRKDVLAGRFITANLALLTLFVCALISAIFNLPKHWYDAGYLYALLLIILIFFLGENFNGQLQKAVARKIFLYLGMVALLSQLVFVNRNLPAFMAGYAGPGIPVGKYESNKTHDDLVAASRTCDIDPVHSKRIVVDDFTYGYFQKSQWPMSITYIWLDNDDESRRQFFSKVDSDGLVVYCSSVPAQYKPFVKKEGNICCIPKNQLKNVFSLP